MTLGHFWPLVAEKAKKPNSEIPRFPKNWFFGLFQPSKAENDPDTENTKKTSIYKRIFLYLMTLGHFWSLVSEKVKSVKSAK